MPIPSSRQLLPSAPCQRVEARAGSIELRWLHIVDIHDGSTVCASSSAMCKATAMMNCWQYSNSSLVGEYPSMEWRSLCPSMKWTMSGRQQLEAIELPVVDAQSHDPQALLHCLNDVGYLSNLFSQRVGATGRPTNATVGGCRRIALIWESDRREVTVPPNPGISWVTARDIRCYGAGRRRPAWPTWWRIVGRSVCRRRRRLRLNRRSCGL